MGARRCPCGCGTCWRSIGIPSDAATSLDEVICWLTGYSPKALADHLKRKTDFQPFFTDAPKIHPNAAKITGTICGVKLAEIDHPLMRNIRYLDKLVDELAKGRPMEKILRT